MSASLIFGALIAAVALSAEAPAKVEPQEFAAGQVWTFHNDPSEPEATLTILRIEPHGKLTAVIHISVSAVRTPGGVTRMTHMAFSREAFDRSIEKLVRVDSSAPDLRGYEAWKAAGGQALTMTVNEALEQVRKWTPVADDAPCEFDRERLLALNEHEFDQDMDGGWRKLAA